MCIASGVEIFRQTECHESNMVCDQIGYSIFFNALGMNISNLTLYAQLPQDISMGIAQLFNLLASFEFAYFVAPRAAQTLFMALHNFSAVLASYVSLAYAYLLSYEDDELDFTVSIDI